MDDVISRRSFFKALAGGAVAVAALPAILEPARTIFLPPRQGWWQPEMRMREVQQYLINTDSLAMRYDMKWVRPDGYEQQRSFTFASYPNPGWPADILPSEVIQFQRAQAREIFERAEREHGFRRSHQVLLPLPRGVDFARHV